MRPAEFTLTDDHLRLIRRMNIDWYDNYEGAAGADSKRPYGSDAIGDVCRILGWTPEGGEEYSEAQESRARKIHRETLHALQVFVQHAGITSGTYVRETPYGNKWRAK